MLNTVEQKFMKQKLAIAVSALIGVRLSFSMPYKINVLLKQYCRPYVICTVHELYCIRYHTIET